MSVDDNDLLQKYNLIVQKYIEINGTDDDLADFEQKVDTYVWNNTPAIGVWNYKFAKPTNQDLKNVVLKADLPAIRNKQRRLQKIKELRQLGVFPLLKRLYDILGLDITAELDKNV